MTHYNELARAPILLVEDDDVDIEAVQRALKKKDISNPLCVARNGFEALTILGKNSQDFDAKTAPCMILLDINMPRMNGLEFLTELRQDRLWHSIPVFMLTTSSRQADKACAYHLNVAGYFLKEHLNAFIEMLYHYLQSNQFSLLDPRKS